MGHVYHSQYLVWFEIGRTELLRSFGTAYRQWEDVEGIYLPVRECHIKYKTAAQYDDLVVVHTQMVRITRASVSFEYQVARHPDNEILAVGGTTHAFISAEGRVCRVADRLLPKFFQ
jgi:acyl-CoA thioester hydrolase